MGAKIKSDAEIKSLAAAAQNAIATENWLAADAALRKMIEQSTEANASLLFNLGLVLKRTGKSTDAAMWLRQAVKIDPLHLDAQFELAATEMDLGLTEESLAKFHVYLGHRPEDSDAVLNAARLALRLGRRTEAKDLAQRLAVLRPGKSETALMQAEVAAEDGAIEDANQVYRTLLAHAAPEIRAAALSAMTSRPMGAIPLNPGDLGAAKDQPNR